MANELGIVFKIVAFIGIFGLIAANVLRRSNKDWMSVYLKFCLDRQWPIFLFGAIFFCAMSALSFAQHRYLLGVFHSFMTVLEVYVLVKFGFQTITPELEQAIEDWDIFPRAQRKQTDRLAIRSRVEAFLLERKR